MADFASSTELQNWLDLDAINSAKATLALAVASSDIREHCGWSISAETITETLDGPGSRSLWLPTLKLTAVAEVKVNDDVLTPVTQYDWTSYGKLIHRGCWPRTPRSVEVTYTHGYTVVPDAVKGVCLMLASRLYNNPEALKSLSETWGPFAENRSYADHSGPGLSEQEMTSLGRYKLQDLG
jgi:hypothetical protein